VGLLLVAQLERVGWWVVPDDSPPVIPFARWPGVSLVNPLAIQSVHTLHGNQRLSHLGAPDGETDSLTMCTDVLCCVMPGEFEGREPLERGELFFTALYERVPEILRQLRWSARSPLFPTRTAGSSHMGAFPSQSRADHRAPEFGGARSDRWHGPGMGGVV